MKARQIGGACAAAIVMLTAGAITGSGAAMAEEQPPSRVALCSTGPIYRSAHVRVDIKCDIKVEFERRRYMPNAADYVGEAILTEGQDPLANQ
ncbi:hypothetical protein [Nonomuraea zeae]|uniref:Secreted protein n=1 Tax=Nonomuraea zeae TaxID=1642303 RepID=A0A5S4FYB5_9ACTN|nr:hypothetical protein [Nonomuraea zeae]TMR25795.1 hypothetical protein ETD85_44705 [Nonomuraea zeae]